MAKKSKLLTALDAHKGRNYEAEKKKKQVKAAEKRKRQKVQALQVSGGADYEDAAELPRPNAAVKPLKSALKKSKQPQPMANGDDFGGFSNAENDDEDDESDSDASAMDEDEEELSDPEAGTTIPQPIADEPSASEADPDSDVPLSDLSEDEREDTIPYQRMTINNIPALKTSTNRIRNIKPGMRFSAHNSLISTLPLTIPDPNDDLTREEEFQRIALAGALLGRKKLRKENVPFTRPADYFAEMVKSDEHMGTIREKMRSAAASKKAASEARALRDAKKFGKQVQVAKQQERAKEKRETLEKIKGLKRKRQGAGGDTGLVHEREEELFERIDVEEGGPARDGKGRERGTGMKRQKRDQKFGFGGKKRFKKSGDAVSTGDMGGFSAKKMKKGGTVVKQRPGKARRAAAR